MRRWRNGEIGTLPGGLLFPTHLVDVKVDKGEGDARHYIEPARAHKRAPAPTQSPARINKCMHSRAQPDGRNGRKLATEACAAPKFSVARAAVARKQST